MTWGIVIVASVAVVSSISNSASGTAAAAKQSTATNNAIVEANVANTVRTGYRVGLANMQRGLQKRQTIQTGFDITKAGESALGQTTANAAASGTIGSSVDAVVKDVTMKVGEAQAQLTNQAEIDATNYNTTLQNITTEGAQNIRSANQVDLPSESDMWGNALMAGASSFATSYAGSKMSLGAGKASTQGMSTSTPSASGELNYGNWGLS